MNYGTDHPLASSTPHTPSTPNNISEEAEHDRQIIPGIPNQVYPTITTDNEAQLPTPGDHESLTDHMNIELNKYLQAAEQRKAEENYFDRFHKATNTLPEVQEAFHHQDTDKASSEDDTSKETPESPEEDTGPPSATLHTEQDDCLSTIPEEDREEEEEEEEDPADQDTLLFDEEIDQSDNKHFGAAVDTTSDDSLITMGQLITAAFVSDLVHVPTEKVGCLQVTQTLQQFLDEYPPKM